MISAREVLGAAEERGFDFFTGVPCSFLTPLINAVIGSGSTDYVGAVNEGDAVAIAAGAWLGGRETVVMCQNSGLGNAINPLTSLNWPFRIPTLLIVTWRGQPGLGDEPQHALMGAVLKDLLRDCELEQDDFPTDPRALAGALDRARDSMAARSLPYAFVLQKGTIGSEALNETALEPRPRGRHVDLCRGSDRPTRFAALERFLAAAPETAAVIATTGECGRELFTLADRPQHLYQVGSMGCASAMGLGVALTTGRQVAVLDGDGAALMRLGNLATVGAHAPAGMVHVILDNGVHDSTGGQATVSPVVDFARVALACGYATGTVCDHLAGFEQALGAAFATPGPHLVHLRIRPGSISNLGRPTVKPPEVARRFRAFLTRVA
ncbi:MAG TPA: phosphonopyruvate decarboxylase [Geminicoccaceae bacterium]